MGKSTKKWLITAVVLVVLGLGMVASSIYIAQKELPGFGFDNYETRTYEISEPFSKLHLETDTADITFSVSKDNTCRVVCCEPENIKHDVSVQDGSLRIFVQDFRKWYEHIDIFQKDITVVIYLPASEYSSLVILEDTGDIRISQDFTFENMDIVTSTGTVRSAASTSESMKIHTSTGYIYLDNISAGSLDLKVSTGNVNIHDVICQGEFQLRVSTGSAQIDNFRCQSFTTTGNTGDLTLKDVIAEGLISIERSTGDVTFEKCDAAALFIQTDTGDVEGSLLSEKIFIVSTDTGDIRVPQTYSGGRCVINTDTGDISFTLESN